MEYGGTDYTDSRHSLCNSKVQLGARQRTPTIYSKVSKALEVESSSLRGNCKHFSVFLHLAALSCSMASSLLSFATLRSVFVADTTQSISLTRSHTPTILSSIITFRYPSWIIIVTPKHPSYRLLFATNPS